jgi:putative glutamine amidotransferase
MEPRIAIPLPNSDLDYSARTLLRYTRAISLAGGEPVSIALTATPEQVARIAKTCDGVLLPGSPADLDPQKYGEKRHPRTAAADAARDMVDELLLQDAHNMRKPLLGICYGLQSLNVWRSGTLVQDIESPVLHQRPDDAKPGTVICHLAAIESASRLGGIIGASVSAAAGKEIEITVNSSHHQSVAVPGDGLRVVARSPRDGVIEAVESTLPEQFAIGVQWHPERSYEEDAPSRAIFAALIEAARAWHERMMQHAGDFETATRKL